MRSLQARSDPIHRVTFHLPAILTCGDALSRISRLFALGQPRKADVLAMRGQPRKRDLLLTRCFERASKLPVDVIADRPIQTRSQ